MNLTLLSLLKHKTHDHLFWKCRLIQQDRNDFPNPIHYLFARYRKTLWLSNIKVGFDISISNHFVRFFKWIYVIPFWLKPHYPPIRDKTYCDNLLVFVPWDAITNHLRTLLDMGFLAEWRFAVRVFLLLAPVSFNEGESLFRNASIFSGKFMR